MGAAKDLWFDEMERLMQQYIDAGMPEDEAYEKASEMAGSSVAERLADMADYERKRRREEGK